MSADRFTATYLIETAGSAAQAAEVMAGEQSAGTFVSVPGETEELLRDHGAQVDSIADVGTVVAASLPGSRPSGDEENRRRAEVVLSFPVANVGSSLPQLLTTVGGNLFELGPLSGVRLLDLSIPDSFAETYPGPQFGVEGTRRLVDVWDRPLIGTIIKPSVGLSPRETADIVRSLCDAGVDFIKDDELIADPPYSPLAERVKNVMRVIDDHADTAGRRVMYAFNITGDLDAMRRGHDVVRDSGGTCVMISLLSVGLAGIAAMRRHSDLPIHGHRNGWGAVSRHPALGFSFRAYQKLWRLAGADHLHVNGLRNKFTEPDDSVISSAQACLEPIFGGDQAMPVFSSGQWAGQAHDTLAALDTTDLIHVAGGGIMAHPGGPGAGVTSMREAWDAARAGVDMHEYATDHRALRQAIETFGTP